MSGRRTLQRTHPGLALELLETRTVPSFLAPLSYRVEDAPVAVLAADLDADGRPDLVAANSTSGSVSVLLGNGDGLFRAPQHYPTGRGANSIAAADFDGDGILDLATTNAAVNTVSVLRGLGDGTVEAAVNYAVGSSPRSVAVADFNTDGFADLLVLLPSAGQAALLLNNGDGTFQAPTTFTVGPAPRAVATTDFNGDGLADLAVTRPDSSVVSVLLGNGDGSFQTLPDGPTGRFPQGLTVADFNGDGISDLATATIDGATVLLGNGDGTFVRHDAPFRDRYYTTNVAAGDFNADGVLDLALGGADADSRAIYGGFSVQLGNGDGTFRDVEFEDSTLFAQDLAAADFNGDGVADLAAASYLRVCDEECSVYANSLLVLRGTGTGDWQRARVLDGGRSPNTALAADLNGDGLPDLLTASFNGVGALMGNGDGSFVRAGFIMLPRVPFALATGDFNGDGLLDVAATQGATFPTYTDGSLIILLGNGDGTFQLGLTFATDSWPSDVATGDVNGDGVLDLVVANAGVRPGDPASVTVFLGVGDGDFVLAENVTTTLGGFGTVAIADLNLDGFADVVHGIPGTAANRGVYILLSNGDGTLQPPARYLADDSVLSVLSADLDGDGIPDLALGTALGVQTLRGLGDGTFDLGAFAPLSQGVNALALGDFNADGIPDLAAISSGGNSVSALLGRGDLTFRDAEPYAVRQAPRDVTAADFNGDGFADLAVASGGTWPSYADGGVNLLLNDGYWPEGNLPNPGELGDDPLFRPKRKHV